MKEINEINENLGQMEEELENFKQIKDTLENLAENSKKIISEAYEKSAQDLQYAKDKLDVVRNEFDKETEKINDLASNEYKKTRNESQQIVKNSQEMIKSLDSLSNRIQNLIKKLDKVDFPTRLDKIDNSISSINNNIQIYYNKFDQINEKLNGINKIIENKFNEIQNIANKNKIIQTILIILIILIAGGLGYLIYLG